MLSEKGGVKPPHSKAGSARKCPDSKAVPLHHELDFDRLRPDSQPNFGTQH